MPNWLCLRHLALCVRGACLAMIEPHLLATCLTYPPQWFCFYFFHVPYILYSSKVLSKYLYMSLILCYINHAFVIKIVKKLNSTVVILIGHLITYLCNKYGIQFLSSYYLNIIYVLKVSNPSNIWYLWNCSWPLLYRLESGCTIYSLLW